MTFCQDQSGFEKKEVIGNVLNTCIILHNMRVQKQCKHYISEWVYYINMPVDAVEDEPLSLFGSLEVDPDGSIAQDAIGSRMYQIGVALYNELEHHGLMDDLKEHIWNRRNNSNIN